MYIVPQHAQIHYRCALDICDDRSMDRVRQCLWGWVKKKVGKVANRDRLFNNQGKAGWFFKGRYDEENEKYKYIKDCERVDWVQVRTTLVGDDDAPLLWSMELIHPDSTTKGMFWATNVSLVYNSESSTVRFTAVVRKYLRDYYIGAFTETSQPSTPVFVPWILKDHLCRCGKIVINPDIRRYSDPRYYSAEDIPKLSKELTDPKRRLPFVLLVQTSDLEDNDIVVLENNLEKWARGNANIYVLSSSAYKELLYHVNDMTQSNRNHLLPSFEGNSEFLVLCSLPRREGHFLKRYDEINESVISEIVCSVSRYSKGEPRDLFSFQSVLMRQRILDHVRKSRDLQEMQELFESDNEELSKDKSDLEKKYRLACEKNKELEETMLQMQTENESLENASPELQRLKKKIEADICLIGKHLSSLSQQISLCKDIFKDKIYVTNSAVNSAKDYDKTYHGGSDFYAKSWQMLLEVYTTLYLCFTTNGSGNIESRFNAKRIFANVVLSMNEGRQTNSNSNLIGLRTFSYKGKPVTMTYHLKMGNNNMALRLYFFFDHEEGKIVIGYWGEHLKNSSSKKNGTKK